MIPLLLAESNRLVSRRMTRFFPLILAVIMIIGSVIAYFVIQQDDASVDFVQDLISPSPDGGTGILGPLGFLIPIMGFVIGSSYFGADQKAGMIEHLLTWEPRRGRLLLARILGGAGVTFVITTLLSAFFVGILYVLSAVAGTTGGMTSSLWLTLAGAVVRSGLAGAIFFVIGLTITVLTNSSTGAIVSFLIYAFVIEGGLLQFFLPKVSVWLPMTNANSFVEGKHVRYLDESSSDFGSSMVDHHGYGASGLILLALTAVLSIVAVLFFGRRDID